MIEVENASPAATGIQRTYQAFHAGDKAKVTMGITMYGCDPGETALIRIVAERHGVTPTITDVPVSEDNTALASGNRCISVSHKSPVTNATLRALSRAGVRYISTRSAGFNHIDVDYAKSVGITVAGVAYSPDSVADYTLMLMLMLLRSVKSTLSRVEAQDFTLNEVRGKELRDMTVGVIGTGRIGAAVIDRLHGFGAQVLAYDHRPKISVDYVSLDALLQESDIVTLHTPLTADTTHLLDQRRLSQMKRGAYIINTARGPLIDTKALIAALECGDLSGAALDVLEGEQGVFYADHRKDPVKDVLLPRLQALPNVLITPHTAYYTDHALRDIIEHTIINCQQFEKEKIA